MICNEEIALNLVAQGFHDEGDWIEAYLEIQLHHIQLYNNLRLRLKNFGDPWQT